MGVSAESRRRSNQQAGWGGDDLAGQDQLWERVRFLAGTEWAAERGRENAGILHKTWGSEEGF